MCVVNADISKTAVGALLAITVGLFTSVGGLAASVCFSFWSVACAVGLALAYFIQVFYNPSDRQDVLLKGGDIIAMVYNSTVCAMAPPTAENEDNHLMTFYSNYGLMEAVLIVLCE